MQNEKLSRCRTVLSVLFLVFTIYSLFYIGHEARHECSGEDCPVCYVIQVAEQNLKLLGVALAVVVVSSFFKKCDSKKINAFPESVLNPSTLISQKIRLND